MRFSLPGLAVLFAATLAAQTVPLDIRPGLWKSTTTSQTNGAPPIPPEVLERLTPEQRAKMEERMKGRPGGPTTYTHQRCVTREDLHKPIFGETEKQNCRRTIVRSTSSEQEFHIDCGSDAMKTTGTVHLQALDSENVRGTVKMAMTDGAHTMNVNADITAKWLGSSCSAADNK